MDGAVDRSDDIEGHDDGPVLERLLVTGSIHAQDDGSFHLSATVSTLFEFAGHQKVFTTNCLTEKLDLCQEFHYAHAS